MDNRNEQALELTKKYYTDVALMFQNAGEKPNGEAEITLSEGRQKKCGLFRKVMFESHPEAQKRSRIEKAMNAFLISKIGTSDLGALLITSLSDRISWIRDESTKTLNIMEAWARPGMVVDDWTYRISERRQGQIYASRINPEVTLPAEVAPVWAEKYNTLGFWGDPISASFVGSQMASRQRGIDVLQQASESEMLRIRRAKNRDFINGREQKSYQPTFVPQIGGLLERSLTNTDTAGGGDLSIPLMETNLAKIDVKIGTSVQKLALSVATQVRTMFDTEVDRYGGNNVQAFYNFSQMVKEKLAAYRVVPDRYFESSVSGIVPFVREVDMAAGTVVIITLEPDYMPLEARFMMGNEFGPWSWIRPIQELREVVMIMDGGTLDDPGEETHVVISNCA